MLSGCAFGAVTYRDAVEGSVVKYHYSIGVVCEPLQGEDGVVWLDHHVALALGVSGGNYGCDIEFDIRAVLHSYCCNTLNSPKARKNRTRCQRFFEAAKRTLLQLDILSV